MQDGAWRQPASSEHWRSMISSPLSIGSGRDSGQPRTCTHDPGGWSDNANRDAVVRHLNWRVVHRER